MKLYLAGKISDRDWRAALVEDIGRYGTASEDGPYAALGEQWPTLKHAILGRHDYVGPYFISCDHRCYHGAGEHGVGASFGGEMAAAGGVERQQQVIGLCVRAIQQCDVFFAWIDTLDAYGTLVELGMAHAFGKRIWVGVGQGMGEFRPGDRHTGKDRAAPLRPIEDLWFGVQGAERLVTGETSPYRALVAMLRHEDSRLAALTRWRRGEALRRARLIDEEFRVE